MQPLNNILRKFIKSYGIEGAVALNAVRSQWAAAVGETVSAHTYPDTIRNTILTVNVDSPQWLHHLSFYKDDIIKKLDRGDVKEVRFRIGRAVSQTAETGPADEHQLSEEEERFVETTLKGVRDEELKSAFRKLITRGLGKSKDDE